MNFHSHASAKTEPKLRQLGDLLDFRNDIVHPKDKPDGIGTFVGLEHIERDTGIRLGSEQINLSEMTGRRARFYTGDIVYGYLRPCLNKVWRAEFDGLCSVDQYVFKAKPEADPNYIVHFLRSAAFLRTAPISNTPGQLPRIRSGEIAETPILLPGLDEQRRIAAILDQADDLRCKRRAALERLQILLAVTFSSMFGDPLSNSRGWPSRSTLGELAVIASGVTKGRKLNKASSRQVPYLAVANVQDRALQLTSVKSIEATEDEIARYRLMPGDLLLTEGGDPDKLGRGTLWQGELPECIHQNHIFRVRLCSDLAEPTFLNWLIASERGKRYFLQSAKQTTGIASINMGQLRGFPVLLPPVDLQRAFAARVAEIDKLKAVHRAHLAKLNTLFASLQDRAFRGEL